MGQACDSPGAASPGGRLVRPVSCAIAWRAAVFKHRRTPEATRVLLLYLADHVRHDETVSVPRITIARALGIEERRVTERVKSARDLGWLVTVTRGQKGLTAVHLIRYPSTGQGDANQRPDDTELRPPELAPEPGQGADMQPASSYRGPHVSPRRRAQGERRAS